MHDSESSYKCEKCKMQLRSMGNRTTPLLVGQLMIAKKKVKEPVGGKMRPDQKPESLSAPVKTDRSPSAGEKIQTMKN